MKHENRTGPRTWSDLLGQISLICPASGSTRKAVPAQVLDGPVFCQEATQNGPLRNLRPACASLSLGSPRGPASCLPAPVDGGAPNSFSSPLHQTASPPVAWRGARSARRACASRHALRRACRSVTCFLLPRAPCFFSRHLPLRARARLCCCVSINWGIRSPCPRLCAFARTPRASAQV